MNALINIFKRYFAFGILLVLIALLLWIRLYVEPKNQNSNPPSLLTPTPIPVPQTIKKTETNATGLPNVVSKNASIKYSGPEIVSPNRLAILTTIKTEEKMTDLAKRTALLFNFNSDSFLKNQDVNSNPFFLYQKNKEVLTIGGSYPNINYINPVTYSNNQFTLINEEIINKIRGILTNFSTPEINYGSVNFRYYKVSSQTEPGNQFLQETDSQSDFSYLGVYLTYKLSGLDTVVNNQIYPIFFLFDQSGNIIKTNIQLLPKTKEISTTNVRSFNEVVKLLDKETKIIKVFSANDLSSEETPVYDLKTINFTSVKIVYYLPSNVDSPILPYYFFEGQARDDKENLLSVSAVIPVN